MILAEKFKKIGNDIQAFGISKKPEILLIGGLTLLIGGTVTAAIAGSKTNKVLDKAKEEAKEVKNSCEEGSKDESRALTKVYLREAAMLCKLYAIPTALTATGALLVCKSHGEMSDRYTKLSAAYLAVDTAYKNYRQNVIDAEGEDKDREYRLGIKKEEVEVTNEKGKTKTVKADTITIGDNLYSQYAKFFDASCKGFEKGQPEYNMMFLKEKEFWANNELKTKGYLFLNDVYDMLGIDRTEAGQIVGWIYDPKDDSIENFIDFGIFDARSEANRRFVNGMEDVILLDFNVQGPIIDKI